MGLLEIISSSIPLTEGLSTNVTALILTATLCLLLSKHSDKLRLILVFSWACFIKPIMGKLKGKPSEQQQLLENFYQNQAHVYDLTREYLLKGRQQCLELAVAHLTKRQQLVWVDIGGGTGKNIEYMDEIFSIAKHFKAVYLVDLSPLLCEVARKRFESNPSKFHNVHVIVADACDFKIDYATVDLITFSYSLSMIPTFNSTIDHAVELLDKSGGIVACVDFGIQSSDTSMGRVNTVGGIVNRNIPWILRNFWRIWFEADKVFLDSSRRNYLEYKFGTIKSLNAYNNKLGKIPYYTWIGCHKSKSSSVLHRINCLATESPYLAPSDQTQDTEYSLDTNSGYYYPISKGHEAALSNFAKKLPFPLIYYQQQVWRVYYDEISPRYTQFNDQYIYAFTWEDPREDHKILKFNGDETVLAITSAGDNILDYACLPNPPKRIHAVDLNPAQNHLLELKLAAFKCLKQKQIWKMFGEGKIANFKHLLVNKLSPHMSSQAFQFWFNQGEATFDVRGKGLYDTGSTRWALRVARYVFKIFGVTKIIDQLCECQTLAQQLKLWNEKIKPTMFNPFVATLMVGNPIFLWKALGVPANQAAMMGDSVLKYVIDTFDPVIKRSLIATDNYFYYLTLKGRYHPENCPTYLTTKGYNALYNNKVNSKTHQESPLDTIRIHTETLNDVFARLNRKSITIAIIMDHMDWFSPQGNEAHDEIVAIKQCLAPGGRVMLRSAAQFPWYIKTFESLGFKCKPAAIRHRGESIDRTNMYASTWVCTKLTSVDDDDDVAVKDASVSDNMNTRRRMSSLKI